MRFRLRFSRLGAIGDELLEVQRDFLEDGLEAASGGGCSQEPTAYLSLDLVDFQGAVDLVGRTGVEKGVGSDIGGQCIEVVEDLSPKSWRAACQDKPEVCSSCSRCLIRLNASSIRQRPWYSSANAAAGKVTGSRSDVITTCTRPFGVATRTKRTVVGVAGHS